MLLLSLNQSCSEPNLLSAVLFHWLEGIWLCIQTGLLKCDLLMKSSSACTRKTVKTDRRMNCHTYDSSAGHSWPKQYINKRVVVSRSLSEHLSFALATHSVNWLTKWATHSKFNDELFCINKYSSRKSIGVINSVDHLLTLLEAWQIVALLGHWRTFQSHF